MLHPPLAQPRTQVGFLDQPGQLGRQIPSIGWWTEQSGLVVKDGFLHAAGPEGENGKAEGGRFQITQTKPLDTAAVGHAGEGKDVGIAVVGPQFRIGNIPRHGQGNRVPTRVGPKLPGIAPVGPRSDEREVEALSMSLGEQSDSPQKVELPLARV